MSALALGLPALAQANGPGAIRFEDGLEPVRTAAPSAAAAACVLESGPQGATSYFPGFDDHWTQIYSLIRPTDCSACPEPQSLELTSVSFGLRWTDPCPGTDVEVSIVGATGDPACPTPDPNNVLCGPVVYTVSSAGSGTVIYTVPLPMGCCISEDAYVCLKFLGPFTGDCYTGQVFASIPVLGSTSLATSCQQYVQSAVNFPVLTDWSSVQQDIEALWFSVDADCCEPTPTSKTSWGRVKILYR